MQSTQCIECARYRGLLKCEAFGEEQIPQPILDGRHDHRQPFKGDHGLRFVPQPLKEE